VHENRVLDEMSGDEFFENGIQTGETFEDEDERKKANESREEEEE